MNIWRRLGRAVSDNSEDKGDDHLRMAFCSIKLTCSFSLLVLDWRELQGWSGRDEKSTILKQGEIGRFTSDDTLETIMVIQAWDLSASVLMRFLVSAWK